MFLQYPTLPLLYVNTFNHSLKIFISQNSNRQHLGVFLANLFPPLLTCYRICSPLLVSIYHEVIRINNAQVSSRIVMRDMTLSDGEHDYLLRKDCAIFIPSGISHMSQDNFGSNSDVFDPRRFITSPSSSAAKTQQEKDDEKTQRRSYYPFGRGKHLCPGRNFAFAENLGIASVLILGFDLETKDGGKLVVPDRGHTRFSETIGKPRGEGAKMGVKISRRDGFQGVVWKFDC